ncbi:MULTISPECIES: endonuclease/exonuclease/phosphatase family protein [unclassified Novosphingobium]|uniref:endonuclease/exonuclease/phosphatase family protein n=1 Tax=unclassified Novosphingobium TaxID=2644732 RepID=UPI001F1E6AB5|nr:MULTISPECIES: endonuclease/exonuclease/phosphatase family protein [unclassified Novosphingobium]
MKHLTKMSIAGAAALIVLNMSRPSPAAAPEWPAAAPTRDDGTLSVMTFNIKGLPFPLAHGRAEALAEIASRLRKLRRTGRQPDVILLQEAFIPEAKEIARRAGYAHVAIGSGIDDPVAKPGDKADSFVHEASWLHGEAVGRWIDSGLVILSDHPIVKTRRMAFPEAMCAGFDCLAAKGVLVAWIAVPGRGRPVAVADTHLNSRKASGVAIARANTAFARQASAARAFIRANVDAGTDLIFGGDFNIGKDKARIEAVRGLVSGGREATESVDCAACSPALQADLAAIRERGKDKLYYRSGAGRAMRLRDLEVPFGTQNGADTLSDHMGYVARYTFS